MFATIVPTGPNANAFNAIPRATPMAKSRGRLSKMTLPTEENTVNTANYNAVSITSTMWVDHGYKFEITGTKEGFVQNSLNILLKDGKISKGDLVGFIGGSFNDELGATYMEFKYV